ncbi:restriction endonuclease subunit S [Aliarcobacter butzleri]|uniref:restriction endonuclease subunit S n=1 Tax=Aliarcobacter butzleri TaxID=28197 RepID=UPI002B24E851|nr:restriction endonuclease subunit S [Aliarcobacter butzleri]
MSKLLQFANFGELINWSVKTNLSSLVESKYKVVTLGNHIIEQKDKVKPFDFPEDDFKILGVSNKVGLFDNEIKKGKEINQAYKIVKNGYLAYNPYRINVGSIGIKTDEQKYNLISPAYVVFSCKETLLPEFLFLIFKTQTFNTIINESTRGSVRQILAFDILETLKIPLPTIEEQKEIVNKYHEKLNLSKEQDEQIISKQNDIENYLIKELKYNSNNITDKTNLLSFFRFRNIDKWTVKDIASSNNYTSLVYETVTLSKVVSEKPKYGSNSKGIDKINDTRYIRITDINEDGTLNDEIVSAEKIEEKYILRQDDFLIARSGNTVGKTFLYDKNYGKCMYAGYLIKFVLNQNIINPFYLLYYTKSSIYKDWINSNLRVAGQPNINSQEYLQSPIILPSLDIQEKIVKNISILKNDIQNLKNKALSNKQFALKDFESEIFNEA